MPSKRKLRLNLSCESNAFQGLIVALSETIAQQVLISLARVMLFRGKKMNGEELNLYSLNLSCESNAFQGFRED